MSLPFSLSFDSSRASDSLLAAISYEDRAADGSVLQPGLKSLGNGPTLELWTSTDPVHTACAEGIRYRHNGRALFGLCCEPSRPDIEQQAFDAYLRIQRMLQASSYPQVLRMWNHFPDIHGQTGRVSRYQGFCLGRQRALEAADKLDESTLPAATVIGTREGPFLVYFLAAAEAGHQIENPRQTSAFHYPSDYGPSPSFSRATFKNWGDEAHLYVSGTASIVGHRSQHAGDVEQQLDETIANLNALLAQGRAIRPRMPAAIDSAYYLKVYLRQPEDLALVRSRLKNLVGERVPIVYLQGDICRAELLIEMEALCPA